MKKKQILRFILCSLCLIPTLSFAQEDSTDPTKDKKLFADDKKAAKDSKLAAQGAALSADAAREDEVQFSALTVENKQKESTVIGKGNVLISGQGVQIQANEGSYNTKTKDADVSGNVVITSGQGELSADKAKFNIDSKVGEFSDASFLVEQGSFALTGETVKKLSEDEYELLGSTFTTCQCPDEGEAPWKLKSSRCFLKQEGHGHAYNASMWLYGMPIAYTPYLLFPVKTERSSGLLAPTYGYSNRDGVQLRLPIFVVIDETQDALFTPFLEAKTRTGAALDYRLAIDDNEKFFLRTLYSDESAREDENGVKSLRGTDTAGIFDPTIDTDRFGGLMKFNWQADEDALIPTSIVADGKYASDNLLVREIDKSGIANYSATYLPSTAVMRNQLGDYIDSELSADYTQDLFGDQDYALQRLPQWQLSGQKTIRPFGLNPYGFKMTGGMTTSVTQFSRLEGFDGLRYNATPSLTIPLRYENVVSTKFQASVVANEYDMDSITETVPGQAPITESSSSLTVPKLRYDISTSLEKVYQVEKDGWLQSLAALGASNQENTLRRMKNTIEPLVSFQYVPDRDFENVPNFESAIDRIRERQSMTYGVTSRFYGRFLPESRSDKEIQELTPEVDEIAPSFTPSLLDELSGGFIANRSVQTSSLRQGETRELANISLLELYDRKLDLNSEGEKTAGFSDTYGIINLYPNKLTTFGLGATFDREESEVTSIGTGVKLSTDRGDALKLRYSYKRDDLTPDEANKIAQLELGTEVVLSDRLRLGYFGRYDDKSDEFIENTGAIRLLSACNCWSLDLGFSQRTNPDRDKVMATFTFTGLGDITQDIPFLKQKENSGE